MTKYNKVKVQSSEILKHKWAYQMFFISFAMSIFLGFMSQTILSNLGVIFASLIIVIFIFLGIISDMLGVVAASCDIEVFEKWKKEGVSGAEIGYAICQNSEKFCSFCGDVVGDICSTLCGAGGAYIVTYLAYNIQNIAVLNLLTILISALIAGVTVFFKAIAKAKALKKSNIIVLRIGRIFEKLILKKNKVEKKQKKY